MALTATQPRKLVGAPRMPQEALQLDLRPKLAKVMTKEGKGHYEPPEHPKGIKGTEHAAME
jgi:hypothetical protein